MERDSVDQNSVEIRPQDEEEEFFELDSRKVGTDLVELKYLVDLMRNLNLFLEEDLEFELPFN